MLVPLRRFEEGPRQWKPVSAPEALTALTAVLASSRLKAYRTTNAQGGTFDYEAILLNEQGLIQQCNLSTNKKRRVRCTPIGPDGDAHFEFREGPVGSADWREVSPSCVKQLQAVAAGRGESHYTITYPNGVPHRNVPPVSTSPRAFAHARHTCPACNPLHPSVPTSRILHCPHVHVYTRLTAHHRRWHAATGQIVQILGATVR